MWWRLGCGEVEVEVEVGLRLKCSAVEARLR